ncbi:MAG: PKD domain-containing protein, partial [Bacteroidetes bacterium]|nr:PKD domain-containing protein [Bacteroidota bacterium]
MLNYVVNIIYRLRFSIILILFFHPHLLHAQCQASFSFVAGQYCVNDSVFFSDSSTPPGNLTFFWDFGDGNTSNTQNPAHSYGTDGTYNVTLTIVDTSTSCFDDTVISITIDPLPATPILFDGNGVPSSNPVWTFCKTPGDPDSVNVDFTSGLNMGNFTLDFGDGTDTIDTAWNFAAIITHTYQNLGAYNITLTVTGGNGCTNTITGQVLNLRNPTAGIIGPPAGQNQGCAPHTVRFINNSDPNSVDPTTTFTWDMGDGTTIVWDYTRPQDTLFHTYLPLISDCGLTVTLTAQNQCAASSTTWSPVDIFDIDMADIDPDSTFLCWPNNQVTFTNASNFNCVLGTRSYFWDFGDGNTYGYGPDPTPITNTYPGPGTYTVMMVDSNPCGPDTTYAVVVIATPPTAIIDVDPDTICVGNPVTFYNYSIGGATSYSWNFGDNTGWQIRTDTLPFSYVYNVDKTYDVAMIASFPGPGCSDTDSVSVVVLPGTVASFTMSDSSVCDSTILTITNTSVNADTWFWDFGRFPNDTSDQLNPPVLSYSTLGTFYISL